MSRGFSGVFLWKPEVDCLGSLNAQESKNNKEESCQGAKISSIVSPLWEHAIPKAVTIVLLHFLLNRKAFE